ncbi:hypothetical protein ACJJI4_12220 [Microbulbifer sp. TRSA002]|uniref:hypothetical protein n=1 Tax=Microbulbifer sp. TRSA002 TaxID=3243382 RepID=UPI00403A74C4
MGRFIKTVMIMFSLFAVIGCSVQPKQMYSGERLPVQEEVVLEGWYLPFNSERKYTTSVQILSVDGKSTFDNLNSMMTVDTTYPIKVYLKPGKHNVTVRYSTGMAYSIAHLWFEGEKGGHYRIDARSEGYSASIRIVDTKNNKTVGGVQ